MSEMNESDKQQSEPLSRPKKLELKKTVETGQVRQSFAHGRSKMVTVEVRKKRTFAQDARGRMAEIQRDAEGAAAAESGTGRSAGLSREGAAVGLTNHERARRARVLQDAMKVEEERQADEMAFGVAEIEVENEPSVSVPQEPAETEILEQISDVEPAPEIAAISERAEADVEMELGTIPPEEIASTTAAEPAVSVPPSRPADETAARPAGRDKPEPASKGAPEEVDEDEERRGKARAKAKTETRKPAGPVGRRGDNSRRAGRLTLTDALDEAGGERVRSLASVRRAREREKQKQLQQNRIDAQKIVREVVVPETITVQELANRMAERGTDVIKTLMKMGVMATINHTIDADTAELVVTEFGHKIKRVSDADVEIGLKGEGDVQENLEARPPVVTVMGHVDHGKTSLLDALRKTDVAAREAGGITQHIGAYQIVVPSGDRVTFIDTPGHAAFTSMRARGANVTDIVVLVVAADDGVMPQTIEAIRHAKAANVPVIVAINKMDRPDANPDRVRNELLQHGVFVESMGGETLCVEVSAKTGENLDRLLEAILLQAELLDLQANPERLAEGVVVETKVERGRGSVATILVQRGTLRVGDVFVAGSEWGRVRGLADATGQPLDEAPPSMPVEILGLSGTPAAGDDFVVVDGEARAREVAEFRQRRLREAKTSAMRSTFEQAFDRIKEGETKELPIVVKADVHGSLEAIVGALEKLSTDEIKANVLHAAVGGINESDVTLARASSALILGFNVRANPQAREQAKRDGVEIRYYSIIYNLTDDLKRVMNGMLAPQLKETTLGYAEIREVFTVTKVGKVAGCMVTEGVVRRGGKVRLIRDDVVIHEGDLGQLKRFKDDVREVREGYDCGIALANYQDIQVGDVIEFFVVEEVAREI